jgi:hypothetical protein
VRASRAALALAFCAGAAAPIAAPSLACAGEGARAALVVDTGAAVTTYCVELPDGSVSGIDLVELAGEQHGLDYSLGFGGEAVCRLEGVGPEGDDCFSEYPEFWGYWHGDGSGGWSWAGTGAGSATIEDGDVDGWSWGTGDNGSNHQAPPDTEHGDVCPVVASQPAQKKDRPRSPSAREHESTEPAAPSGAGPAAAEESPDGAEPETGRPGRRRPPRREPHGEHEDPLAPNPPAPSPTSVAAAPTGDRSGGGPPLTGLVGLAAATALALAARRGSRRRTRA